MWGVILLESSQALVYWAQAALVLSLYALAIRRHLLGRAGVCVPRCDVLQGEGEPSGGVPGGGDPTGVTPDGRREVLGFDVGDTDPGDSVSEDGAFWTAFLRSLKARGLGGVQLVISDAHTGLKAAIGSVSPSPTHPPSPSPPEPSHATHQHSGLARAPKCEA